ncbi:MAG: hypothetical protein SOV43_06995 [Selenomonadaceae bacterium]|nr:hypothetical protein [Selenomonadaceae bacterium]MDY2685903.1 hypothetical protein [Selenomonadaceae bacterium]
MFAWVEVKDEHQGVQEISYSLGTDMTLDGRIQFDRRAKTMKLEKLADGASPAATRDFMEALRERMIREPWATGRAICVSYDRSGEEQLVRRWQMDQQGSFMRFG